MSESLTADFRIVGAEEVRATLHVLWQEYGQGKISVQELSQTLREAGAETRAAAQTQRLLAQEHRLTWQSLREVTGTLRQIGSIGREVTGMWTAYNVAQIRVQDATRDVAEAQTNYNQAVRDFGPNSDKAREAAEKLRDAQEKLAKVNQDNITGYISMGFQVVGLVGSIAHLVTSLGAATIAHGLAAAAVHAHNIAMTIFYALTGPAGWVILGVAAAVGVAALAYWGYTNAIKASNQALKEQQTLEMAPGIPIERGVPSMQVGGWVPYTGLYRLHAGERVLPKSATHYRGATYIQIDIHESRSPRQTADEVINRLERRGAL